MGCEQSVPQQRGQRQAAPTRGAAQKSDWASMKPEEVLEMVRNEVIGQHTIIDTPFGKRKMTYADYTASGRGLAFVEDFIRDEVLPYYANTHTEASITGRQTNIYREDARAMIKSSCNAGDEFACIFAGSGSTTAICTLAGMLDLHSEEWGRNDALRPLVVHGPMEHHSNILPWRESDAYTLECGVDEGGLLDLRDLDNILTDHAGRSLRIVTVSAASNVSGLVADVEAISKVCRRHGALLFFDYACGAPYMKIDAALADAVFISPHKFIGGPGTPGVVLVRRSIVRSEKPYRPGGGTVDFVEARHALYSPNIEAREEGGTPEIVGAIRAGLCFRIKDMVTAALIEEREQAFVERAWKAWKGLPVAVLGGKSAKRVSVISFLIGLPDTTLVLHYNYIVALLNDMYGIQTRGGCMCAGPYGGRLFGFSAEESTVHRTLVQGETDVEPTMAMKPGFARLNLNWFLPDHEVDFILAAVAQVAAKGWRMMAQYEFCGQTGAWTKPSQCQDHRLAERFAPKRRGGGGGGKLTVAEEKALYARYLAEADKILDAADPGMDWTCPPIPLFEQRWFAVPYDLGSPKPDYVPDSVKAAVPAPEGNDQVIPASALGVGHFIRGEYRADGVPPSPLPSPASVDIEPAHTAPVRVHMP